MDILSVLFGVLGGLALFLFGLKTLSDALRNAAGERMKNMIEKLTSNPVKGVAVGGLTTAIVQSSSLTMVTLIGLLNAGLLSLEQAIGVMLGAEIGTTITAQMLAFKVGVYYLPIIAIGFFLMMLGRSAKQKYAGQIILGFGLLFLGMDTMKGGVSPLKESPAIQAMLLSFGSTPVLGTLAGAVFTGIIQSSSATIGLIIAMGMEGMISLPAAVAIILGANIGTCVTGLIASIGSKIASKRTAVAQLLFNSIGAGIFLMIFPLFVDFVSMTSGDLPRQIANAHTISNSILIIIFLPLIGAFAWLVKRVIPGEDPKIVHGMKYVNDKLLGNPAIALSQSFKETERMGKTTLRMLRASYSSIKGNGKKTSFVHEQEICVDMLFRGIDDYLKRISARKLSERLSRRYEILRHSISDIERVADHADNLAELTEMKTRDNILFSEEADKEMKRIFRKTIIAFKLSLKALTENDRKAALKVQKMEDGIDAMADRFEDNHMKRMKEGVCNPEAAVIFVEMLRNLERISDHANNIANSVAHGF